jgi:2-polyprenyl-3-methyl-5-hydroxy-6-metoxy-1,4-benzoquinol methylase
MKAARPVSQPRWPGELEEVRECPVCQDPRRADELENLTDLSFGVAPGTWSFKRCLGCRALYLHPRPDPSSLPLAYGEYFTHTPLQTGPRSAASRLKHALANGYRNRRFGLRLRPALGMGALLVPLFPALAAHLRLEDRGLGRPQGATSRLLDVGCGNGHFLLVAQRLGWKSYGVEIDTAAAQAARAGGGEILGAQVGELGARYEQFFDVVTLSHVIEHVPDPIATLRHCFRVLKPGGKIWIETPNIDSVGYDTYGSAWRALEAPRHLVLFCPTALRLSLERAGFEQTRVLPPRDVGERLFRLSASMQLGRIAEHDDSVLPGRVRAEVRRALRHARKISRNSPLRSEFLGMVAYRPGASA